MILRGCCSSASILGFFMHGSLLRLDLHGTPEKGRKDCSFEARMPPKPVRLRSIRDCDRDGWVRRLSKGNNMGGTGNSKKSERPKKDDRKSKTSHSVPPLDDDDEDGD